eukprot:7791208-Alexandrium_andersonii.AAC.1
MSQAAVTSRVLSSCHVACPSVMSHRMSRAPVTSHSPSGVSSLVSNCCGAGGCLLYTSPSPRD